ncbi:cell wall integrity and stress response component 2 [Astatotilapia calliptera]|uniref:cell wall integrity and stress response component 2 n=1 Tax=Astatotilapia calliptera TaxID=8154 RepID=UPI000E40D8F2|nr:cell wall integrity and stress response component 2-like [Astatotilapia calliptera]
MDVKFTALAYCHLALLFSVAQTENGTSTPQPTFSLTTLTTLTQSDSTSPISNLTEETTLYTSTQLDNKTVVSTTAATTERTSHYQTSQSATTLTPLTNSTTLRTTSSSTQMSTFTAQTTAAIQTTVGNSSTPSTPVITTENATHTTMNRTRQDVGLNVSERNMTIVFSTVLGAFAVLLVFLMFHKCKQKIQYLHQPLNNAQYTDTFVADDDTLVISGGLYDGHPIYDNVPTAPADQSQFHLEFLH